MFPGLLSLWQPKLGNGLLQYEIHEIGNQGQEGLTRAI